jgi:hypothetical protein
MVVRWKTRRLVNEWSPAFYFSSNTRSHFWAVVDAQIQATHPSSHRSSTAPACIIKTCFGNNPSRKT